VADEPEVREVRGAFETLQKNEKYVSNILPENLKGNIW
jgi:hypothetical protein